MKLHVGVVAFIFSVFGTAWAENAPVAPADPAKGQAIVAQKCAACHAADGNSMVPANPRLAGQHPEYVQAQLHAFKQADKGPRNNPIMSAQAAGLSDEDMRNVAAYFAGQKPAAAKSTDGKLANEGRALYKGGVLAKQLPACAACHGPTGAGMPSQYPRLGGQHRDYVIAQLQAFKQGSRKNAVMQAIATKMSEQEMNAVAEYIQGMR